MSKFWNHSTSTCVLKCQSCRYQQFWNLAVPSRYGRWPILACLGLRQVHRSTSRTISSTENTKGKFLASTDSLSFIVLLGVRLSIMDEQMGVYVRLHNHLLSECMYLRICMAQAYLKEIRLRDHMYLTFVPNYLSLVSSSPQQLGIVNFGDQSKQHHIRSFFVGFAHIFWSPTKT